MCFTTWYEFKTYLRSSCRKVKKLIDDVLRNKKNKYSLFSYPEIAKLRPYTSIRTSMARWKSQTAEDEQYLLFE